MTNNVDPAILTPVQRLSKDLASAATTISDAEARFLVDAYYSMQDARIRADGQIRSIVKNPVDTGDIDPTTGAAVRAVEPHDVLKWLSDQNSTLEQQTKRALERYVGGHRVGEWLTCAPPDAEVLVESRRARPIGDLVTGDAVLSYNRKKASLTRPRPVTVGVNIHDGILARLTTSDHTTRTTLRHKWLIQWQRAKSDANHCVYLMRQGDRFRIGRSTIFTSRPNDTKDYLRLGLSHRSTQENADTWILARFSSDYEASIYEEFALTEYGISGCPFRPARSSSSPLGPKHRDANALERIYSMLSIDLQMERVLRCLTEHDLSIDEPLIKYIGENISRGPTNGIILTTRNLLKVNDIVLMPTPSNTYGRTHWVPLREMRTESYSGPVYSLDVEEHHKYVQDGLITCNSIHGIGPVISAGLLAHIDIHRAVTVGHIWRFAGLDPSVKWLKKTKRPWNAGLKVLCCHPQTMVMTDKGAVRIDQIKIGDQVLTHKGRFRPVLAVHQSEYTGALVGLHSHGNSASPLYVTDNHPIWTETRLQWVDKKGDNRPPSFGAKDRTLRKGSLPDEQVRVMREQRASGAKLEELSDLYGCSTAAVSLICNGKNRTKPMENERMWVRADGVLPGWLLSAPRLPHGPMQTWSISRASSCKKPLPEQIEIDAEIARLLGLFLAEGHVTRYQVGFSFHCAEVGYQAFVADVLQRRFGLAISAYSKSSVSLGWQGIASSKLLANLLAGKMGTNSFDMQVPGAILQGPPEVKAAFLRGWFEGDGDLTTMQLTTSSAAHDAHALLNSLGITASITPYQRSFKISITSQQEFNEIVFNGDLSVANKTNKLFGRIEADAVWTQARENTLMPYVGPVFNLEVEEDESYSANSIAAHNCWKAGESFVKFHNADECFYGKLWKQQKEIYIARNEAGNYAERSAQVLATRNISKDTDAYAAYSVGRFPPAHIHAMARRYAVKNFLVDLHAVWHFIVFGKIAPKPWVITHGGHVHFREPQNADIVPGLLEAYRKA